ncbi:hypothetical protein G6011_06778 [Alternaria panax]|uniref:Uncharacterized protein n=1 Tax=Alternaria panax TaxID=48097 RepID=A0AAD4FH22_9PLEO|nr:hypothetical protein G6011_06778 [Alternaria panax]
MSTTPIIHKYKLAVPQAEGASPSAFAPTGLTENEILDGLFEDEITVGLGLPPIPEPSRSESPISSSDSSTNSFPDPNAHKRKLGSFVTDDDSDYELDESPQHKKARHIEKTVKNNKRKRDDSARRNKTIAAAASAKPSEKAVKIFKSMNKQAYIPTPKNVSTSYERRSEVNLLAQKHVRHVAPVMSANIKTNRDVNGQTNKFDRAESGREIPQNLIKASDHKAERRVDEIDKNISWLTVPASGTYLTMGGSMIPVADILRGSIKYPEYTFVEAIMGTNVKTGKEEAKAYKIKHEKMNSEQSILRAATILKQEKEEAKQARKDEAARKRNEKRADKRAGI